MLVSPSQNKTWHGRLRKSGENQQKLRHFSLSINIDKYYIVMIMVHRHHIRAEKEEWKKALEINMLIKVINVMTEKKLSRTDSYLLQLIIHIFNLLAKLSFFIYFSFYCFTVVWKHFKSEFTVQSQISIREGLNSAWSWNFSKNWINRWVLINKGLEDSFLNKHVFCLYTLKSCLWKLQVILHKITKYKLFYFSYWLIQFWLIQVIQQSFHSTTSPQWWLLHQSKNFTFLKNY